MEAVRNSGVSGPRRSPESTQYQAPSCASASDAGGGGSSCVRMCVVLLLGWWIYMHIEAEECRSS